VQERLFFRSRLATSPLTYTKVPKYTGTNER
jgi:hypothetical protein